MSLVLEQHHLDQIFEEMIVKYSLDKNELHKLLINIITEVYESEFPILLEDDGLYAVYTDREDDSQFSFSKVKYSQQKSKIIISKIQEESNLLYLKKIKVKVINFIKTKKPYLHSTYSYTEGKYDYYTLYYDLKHTRPVLNVQAKVFTTTIKKERVYIDFTSANITKATIVFLEFKNYINLANVKKFTGDISTEIKNKIGIRVWIEVRNINLKENKVYIHLPYKNKMTIIDFIKKRFYDIFGLTVELIYMK